MSSFIYRHPVFYKAMLKLIHRKSLYKRYRYIADLIGKEKRVFELGCGTALLSGFLHRGCSYTGWDLNGKFVEHCRRGGINAEKKDIFSFEDYPENDVTIVCDVLHHVFPKDRELITNALKRTKKLIIIEPYHVRPRLPNYILKKLELLDNDGINEGHSRYMWNMEKCRNLLNLFGKKVPMSTRKIGLDVVATFDPGKHF